MDNKFLRRRRRKKKPQIPENAASNPKTDFDSIKNCPSISHAKQHQRYTATFIRRNTSTRASADDSTASSSLAPIAPLRLESPAGQFLSQILVTHPHLLRAAVDQQLELLQADREAVKQKEEPSTSSTDLVLYSVCGCGEGGREASTYPFSSIVNVTSDGARQS
ncbi:hypothetical protein MRB53_008570 [Persea americana]|uniref:Uncharacterized protein n=1 Tax=Persea americana TaxID=3435 RepID=A0ACC2MM76_PERAE|nr:hypothetical protein MRB53_008570 [Persea americana]